MKRHVIAYLDSLPEDVLAKLLNWALYQGNRLPDRTPFEQRALDAAYKAIYNLDKPE